jgi:hypothetical protein
VEEHLDLRKRNSTGIKVIAIRSFIITSAVGIATGHGLDDGGVRV